MIIYYLHCEAGFWHFPQGYQVLKCPKRINIYPFLGIGPETSAVEFVDVNHAENLRYFYILKYHINETKLKNHIEILRKDLTQAFWTIKYQSLEMHKLYMSPDPGSQPPPPSNGMVPHPPPNTSYILRTPL